MTELPDWVDGLSGTLRESFVTVWQRLPGCVCMMLNAQRPVVLVLGDAEMNRRAPGEMALTTLAARTFTESGMPALLFRASLADKPDWCRVYIIAHELAHVFLHHWQFGQLAPLALMTDDEKTQLHTWQEEHADWLLFWAWGFQDELLAFEDVQHKKLNYKLKPGEFLGRTRWLTGWRSQGGKRVA